MFILNAQDEQQWRAPSNTCKSNNCQLLQSLKDTCNNKIKDAGPLFLLMVSSKRAGGAIDGFIEGRKQGNREHVGPLPLSMVSSNGAGGTINCFIEGRQGGREQGTPHAQLDSKTARCCYCQVGSACCYLHEGWKFRGMCGANKSVQDLNYKYFNNFFVAQRLAGRF